MSPSSLSSNVLRFRDDVTGGSEWPTDRPIADRGGNPRTALTAANTASAAPQDAVAERFTRLERDVNRLFETTVVMIDTLAPEPLELVRPFHVSMQADDEGFRAEFLDANLVGFGETPAEAVWNLKDLIAGTLETLRSVEPSQLGPGPRRQLAVLSAFIKV